MKDGIIIVYTMIVMVYTMLYGYGIYHLPMFLIPWYTPKMVYTTFGVVHTMTVRQPSR
jgi:hypothetical protein